MSLLEDFLQQAIQRGGPVLLEAVHSLALFHPEYGYYKTQAVLGRGGDFVTAPEVSPLFGEVVGAFCLYAWEETLKAPTSFSLVELGPGRGTLMGDVLRVGKLRPAFLENLTVTLVEIHPLLKRRQEEILSSYPVRVRWVEDLEALSDLPGPLIILANEFFDVFPVRQEVETDKGWIARCVDWQNGAFCFTPEASQERIREESPEREQAFLTLLALLKKKGGILWIADYGYSEPTFGDSWQGLYQGRPSSPLQHLGLTDLSAHVDFGRLRTLAEGFSCEGPQTQQSFLAQYGINQRLEMLRQKATPSEKAVLEAGYMRLMYPLQMGELFKVLVVQA